MVFFYTGSEKTILSTEEIRDGVYQALEKLGTRKNILIVPPDRSRIHSQAGKITSFLYEYYSDSVGDILPALGTHAPMSAKEIRFMFAGIPLDKFRIHNWRTDVRTIGTIPGIFIKELSKGMLDYPWDAQVNSLLVSGSHDLIFSVGQVVPHEVAGMANHSKNIFIGCGGPESIHKSHYLGAVCGMEKIMGRAKNPVRALLNQASVQFKNLFPPIIYILTVIGREPNGNIVVRGLFIGDDQECFEMASELSQKVNFSLMEHPLDKIVVYLNPDEYKSTWLGNKAIYRTRMALADNSDLIILAPGIREFGEDPEIEKLIREYGYFGTSAIIAQVKEDATLASNLAAAAHLIHGSSEGRFNITYCPAHLSRSEIESVGFQYASYQEMKEIYNPENLKEGMNVLPDGEQVYYISNPGLGLWSTKEKLYTSKYS